MPLPIKHTLHLLILSSLFVLAACAGKYEDPELSTEAKGVNIIASDSNTLNYCQHVGPVIGYGSSENETRNDIRHQASTHHNANTLVLLELNNFYQKTRLSNYLRTPELTAPKGTKKYYYIDAFTFKAKGQAYICPVNNKPVSDK